MKKFVFMFLICLLTGMMSGCEKTDTPSEDSSNWKSSYTDFLRMKDAEYGSEARFELCYITEDDIPEIIIIHGTSQPSGARIYTYHNGGVVEFARGGSGGITYGQWGTIWYKEKQGLIYERNYTDKDDPHYQHMISYIHDGYMTDYKYELSDFYGSERIDENGNLITTRYEINGTPADEAEYLNSCQEYGINDIDTTYKNVAYGNMAELNESNINQQLK